MLKQDAKYYFTLCPPESSPGASRSRDWFARNDMVVELETQRVQFDGRLSRLVLIRDITQILNKQGSNLHNQGSISAINARALEQISLLNSIVSLSQMSMKKSD